MKRVTGIGGIFFKTKDPKHTKNWYEKHLGIQSEEWGSLFKWRHFEDPEQVGTTSWSPFASDTDYFSPSTHDSMINYRVEHLEELLKELKKEGVKIIGDIETYEYGKFGWILDPDGRKIELWEPNDQPFL